MAIKPEHLDEFLSGYEKPEDLLGGDGLFQGLRYFSATRRRVALLATPLQLASASWQYRRRAISTLV